MNIYRHFGSRGSTHSVTDAFLLAVPSYFIYETSITWTTHFSSGFGNLIKELSGNDAGSLTTQFFSRSAVLVFDSPQVWNPVVGYDAQVAVIYNDDVVIVCFRGSESPLSYDGFRDWFGTNLTFQLQDTPTSWGRGVRVHRGFYVTLSSIYQQVRRLVRELRHGRRIYLTGHSTGGALATLCAYRFQKVGGVNVEGVYTFGAPRVGNNGFAQAYNAMLGEQTYRWVNNLDAGAQLPDVSAPPTPTAGIVPMEPYVHVGRLNYIEPDGSTTYDVLDYDPTTLGSLSLHRAYSDHDMRGYLYRVFDQLPNQSRLSANSPAELVSDDVKTTKLSLNQHRTLLQTAGTRPSSAPFGINLRFARRLR